MKRRQKKRNAYKHCIRSIFIDYEKMLEDPELGQLMFAYLDEGTQLARDDHQRIRSTTRDLPSK